MSGTQDVLVAGIGNVFQSDDAFGIEVVDRLTSRTFPPGVRVEDFGIRGVHLAYELLEGYDALILIDAMPMGEPPGTLAIIEPELSADPSDPSRPMADAHTMNPDVVLATLASMGGSVDRVRIVACQPADVQEGMGLTPAVAAAVEDAVVMCCELVAEIVEPVGKVSEQ
jgi:hydrogenase maturation protease